MEANVEDGAQRQVLMMLKVAPSRPHRAGATDLESRLAAHGELFARDVPTNLCLAAARRQLGRAEESQRWLLRYIAETTVPVGADHRSWRRSVARLRDA